MLITFNRIPIKWDRAHGGESREKEKEIMSKSGNDQKKRFQVGKSDQFTRAKWMAFFLHCAKCQAIKEAASAPAAKAEIYLLWLCDLSRTLNARCNHNMENVQRDECAHGCDAIQCENRYIKWKEWDSFTKFPLIRVKKNVYSPIMCILFLNRYYFSLISKAKSIDWSIRYDPLSRKCWCDERNIEVCHTVVTHVESVGSLASMN